MSRERCYLIPLGLFPKTLYFLFLYFITCWLSNFLRGRSKILHFGSFQVLNTFMEDV